MHPSQFDPPSLLQTKVHCENWNFLLNCTTGFEGCGDEKLHCNSSKKAGNAQVGLGKNERGKANLWRLKNEPWLGHEQVGNEVTLQFVKESHNESHSWSETTGT